MSYAAQHQIQSSERPVAQPVYILRGHASAIHTLAFFRSNVRLLSGDADGWVVVWSLTTKRPVAVWKAHEAAVLGAESWGTRKIITHGRDGRLRIWGLSDVDESSMSTDLPVEVRDSHRIAPWLYHSLDVSTLNFCSFATCVAHDDAQQIQPGVSDHVTVEEETIQGELRTGDPVGDYNILVAVPGAIDSSIEVYGLPSEKQMALIPAPNQPNAKTGMVMSLRILFKDAKNLVVIAGYESGRVYVFKHAPSAAQWQPVYTSVAHSQPILSLDVAPSLDFFFTSGADAIIAKHPLSLSTHDDAPLKQVQTRHAGQQGLHVRSDGKIIATAGWDSRARVYSVKTMKELAVLKWHREGCYATAFANLSDNQGHAISEGEASASNQVVRQSDAVSKPVAPALSRDMRAQFTHWLAVGSKDGKISLWDIY